MTFLPLSFSFKEVPVHLFFLVDVVMWNCLHLTFFSQSSSDGEVRIDWPWCNYFATSMCVSLTFFCSVELSQGSSRRFVLVPGSVEKTLVDVSAPVALSQEVRVNLFLFCHFVASTCLSTCFLFPIELSRPNSRRFALAPLFCGVGVCFHYVFFHSRGVSGQCASICSCYL